MIAALACQARRVVNARPFLLRQVTWQQDRTLVAHLRTPTPRAGAHRCIGREPLAPWRLRRVGRRERSTPGDDPRDGIRAHSEDIHSYDEMVAQAEAHTRSEGLAQPPEFVVVVAGVPFGTAGTTNNLRVVQLRP